MYVILFAINLVGGRRPGSRPGRLARLAALSGCLVALAGFLLSFAPLDESSRGTEYLVRVGTILLVAYVVGFLVYRTGARAGQARTSKSGASGYQDGA
jgi:hypothetical protein